MTSALHLTLASASPRRLDLLARIGVVPDAVEPADIDESPKYAERPRDYAMRMAREKAAAVIAPGFVLGGDTVVAAGQRILPKAEDEQTARQCLEMLSGRRHTVLSAIALKAADGSVRSRLSETMVKFKRLSTEEISSYIAGGDWEGKAGGYAIQGAAEGLILRIDGSHSGVVGLPLYETRTLLKSAGFDLG
ncbi:MAG: Maf family nucleotide pyrophosphatase [Erythrobacter sp.]